MGLSKDFLDKYKHRPAPFGGNGVGLFTYKRTYSRLKDDGQTEEWWETVQRCVEGAQAIDAGYTEDETMRIYDYVFNLKCSFAGRFLWQAGTPQVMKFNGVSLVNCWTVELSTIEDFEFLMTHLMLGGGVGFSVERAVIHDLPRVKPGVVITHNKATDADIIVPDSREGWVRLLHSTLKSFFYTGRSFTYSTILIREQGAPLKTFGGTASGPGALVEGITDICKVLKAREGKKVRSIDVLDVANLIGRLVVAGSARRSAELAMGDPDDYLFLRAKRWDKYTVPAWRAQSNNSVLADSYEEVIDEVWNGYAGGGEAYGLLNRRLARETGRLGDGVPDPEVIGFNPCLTADTKVYVADGRGDVTIGELAAAGVDVPVFCLDNAGKMTVRTMRHPRKTGENVPVVKVTLDDGSSVRVTSNHKLRRSDGSYVEAGNLRAGDSIAVATKFKASIHEIFEGSNARSQDYLWIKVGPYTKAEHRFIAEFHYNTTVPRDHVVHHKDRNALNNSPDNLDIVSKAEHREIHRQHMLGDSNPMRRAKTEWSEEKWEEYKEKHRQNGTGANNPRYSGYTDDDLRAVALDLTRSLGRRFSGREWRAHVKQLGAPINFSKWRRDHLGGIRGLALWAALKCGLEHCDLDPRTQRMIMALSADGYDCVVVGGDVMVRKLCEHCGGELIVHHSRREVSYCGPECRLKLRRARKRHNGHQKAIAAARETYRKKAEIVRQKQADAFLDLKSQLGRTPTKKEWIRSCKERGISFEISRISSPFRKYEDLKAYAFDRNHRVVRVEDDGLTDVYNGTVDEFHNFWIGAFEAKTKSGKDKFHYINNLQCGEIGLESREPCNLGEIFLPRISSDVELADISRLLYKTQKAITSLEFPYKETIDVVRRNRRLGVGVTGWLQASDEQIGWLDGCYRQLREYDVAWSGQRGVSPSVKLTTCKPAGTLSLLPFVTPGVHPAYDHYFIRRIRVGSDDPLVQQAKDAGYNVQYDLQLDGTLNRRLCVVDFPCEMASAKKTGKTMTAVEQLERAVLAQRIWSDNAVSVSVYYKEEELPAIKEWLRENYDNSVKSVSFVLHSDHNFPLPPYESITKEQYQRMAAKLKPMLLSGPGEDVSDQLEGCVGGVCPVK